MTIKSQLLIKIYKMNRLELIFHSIGSQHYIYTKVQLERDQQVGTIWLNSPKNLNALGTQIAQDIAQAIEELNGDKSIKVILLKSKHPKVFSAGADIKSFNNHDPAQYPHSLANRNLCHTFRNHHKPIVAIVDGIALGGGFQIALLTDIILCSPKAVFGLPEIMVGIFPGGGGTQTLTRIVGDKVAKQMILTGLPINAKKAHELNIAYLLSGQNFQQQVKEIVKMMVRNSSSALIAANKTVKISSETSLNQGLQHQASIFQSLYDRRQLKKELEHF